MYIGSAAEVVVVELRAKVGFSSSYPWHRGPFRIHGPVDSRARVALAHAKTSACVSLSMLRLRQCCRNEPQNHKRSFAVSKHTVLLCLGIPCVSGPLLPGVSKSQYRTQRWMERPGTDNWLADAERWPAQTTVLHRIETCELTCIICNWPYAEYLHKMPDRRMID